MRHYENITDQTIQLFPQLFLGKHAPPCASWPAGMKPSDKTGVPIAPMSTTRPEWSIRLTYVNMRKCRKGERSCGSADRTHQAVQPGVPVSEVTACPVVLRKQSAGDIKHGPKCFVTRQSVASKVTSRRSGRVIFSAGRPTSNGSRRRRETEMKNKQMPPVTRRIEDEARAPAKDEGHMLHGVMPAHIFR